MPRKELNSASIWRSADYRSYLGASGFAGMALVMQQLLLSWILIGILQLPAHQVGLLQALIGMPSVVIHPASPMMMEEWLSDEEEDWHDSLSQLLPFFPTDPLVLPEITTEQWLRELRRLRHTSPGLLPRAALIALPLAFDAPPGNIVHPHYYFKKIGR